jgi:hypothetical protein
MTIQVINTGSNANSGDGDSIRSAFIKVNQNFTEIATLLGTTGTDFTEAVADAGATLLVHSSHSGMTAVYNDALNIVQFTVAAGPTGPAGPQGETGPTGPAGTGGGFSTTSSLVNGSFVTSLNSFGNLVTSGNVLPNASNQFNLGSDLRRWNTVYVNTLTIRQAIVVGGYDSDNYSRIRHLESTPFTGGEYRAYGFASAYEQSTVLVNEDANINQVLFLGDTGPGD